jgi:hypothetical protein
MSIRSVFSKRDPYAALGVCAATLVGHRYASSAQNTAMFFLVGWVPHPAIALAGCSNDIWLGSKTTQGSDDRSKNKSGIVTGTRRTGSAEHEL